MGKEVQLESFAVVSVHIQQKGNLITIDIRCCILGKGRISVISATKVSSYVNIWLPICFSILSDLQGPDYSLTG